jgi:tetratricopeptide (TPR) repeat protein
LQAKKTIGARGGHHCIPGGPPPQEGLRRGSLQPRPCRKGQLDDAIAEYREAIRLNGSFAAAHRDLATALERKGQQEEAIAEYRGAISLKKDDFAAHYNLGGLLRDYKHDYDGAIIAFREALRLKKDYGESATSQQTATC